MKRRILVFTLILFAAACLPTGGVRLTHEYVSSVYDSGEFAYAGAGRDLHTVVHGNPFGSGQSAFGVAVTDAMQGRHWGQRTKFTTAPGPDARKTYKVVLLFGPPRDFTGLRLCRDDDVTLAGVPRRGDRIDVFAAFCRGNKSLTEIKGSIPSATGMEDQSFSDLVAQVTRALFPPSHPLRDSDNCPNPLNCP